MLLKVNTQTIPLMARTMARSVSQLIAKRMVDFHFPIPIENTLVIWAEIAKVILIGILVRRENGGNITSISISVTIHLIVSLNVRTIVERLWEENKVMSV